MILYTRFISNLISIQLTNSKQKMSYLPRSFGKKKKKPVTRIPEIPPVITIITIISTTRWEEGDPPPRRDELDTEIARLPPRVTRRPPRRSSLLAPNYAIIFKGGTFH